MSGWFVARQQASTAVWGGVAGAPAATPPVSGWFVARQQASTAVWGGITGPVPAAATAAAAAAPGGFQDRRPGYLKKRILFGM